MGARMARRVKEDSGIDVRRLSTLARRLRSAYPLTGWWPFDEPFAIVISAVLTQQTRWSGVLKAMEALQRERLLTPTALSRASHARLERLLRPTGFYRQKARALHGISCILVDRFEGSVERAFKLPTSALRDELLSWPGVGEETADSILLYAARRPVFVVDAYTYRLMARFGAVELGHRLRYQDVAAAWARITPGGTRGFQAMHGAIVEHGKGVCTTVPQCHRCPMEATCAQRGV